MTGWTANLFGSDSLRYGLALAAAGLLPVKRSFAYRLICLALALLWSSVALSWDPVLGGYFRILAGLEALIFLAQGLSGQFEVRIGRAGRHPDVTPLAARPVQSTERPGTARGGLGGVPKSDQTVVFKPLAFPARNGGWAVLGTVLILYCLIAFPLLGRGLHLEVFGQSAVDFPFPLPLFTCAVLFFAVDRGADLALMPLLLGWALPGGPLFPQPGRAELPGLEVALLLGALFVQQPLELRAAGERGAAYRIAVQRRAALGYGLWVLTLGTILLIFLTQMQLLRGLGPIPFHLALLSALGIVLWLVFPAWQSLWFRYVAWHGARVAGSAWAAVREGWRWALLLLLIALLAADSIKPAVTQTPNAATSKPNAATSKPNAATSKPNAATPKPDAATIPSLGTLPSPGSWHERWNRAVHAIQELRRRVDLQAWWELFFTAVLMWLFIEIYRARKRLVIGKFTSHIGGPGEEGWVEGLGLALQSELACISDLYRIIDEVQPSFAKSVQSAFEGSQLRDGTRLLGVTVEVQDVGEILKDATVSLGALHVSTQFLASLFNRIFSGPQLTGALSQLDERYILTAQWGRGRRAKSWRVDSAARASSAGGIQSADRKVEDMVVELAYRVATDLVPIGSDCWQAVRHYTEGLRFYREAQGQLKNRHRNLREAERCLMRALNEDQAFTQCYYNLGVVYFDLGQLASAEMAFRRALAEDPVRYDACYALAETFCHGEKFLEAAWFSRTAIGIDAAQARAWDLQAYARRILAGDLGEMDLGEMDLGEILEAREIAVALAWRALCRAALHGVEAAEKQRKPALLYTRNLAAVLAWQQEAREESLRLLQQAAWLDPQSAALRFHRGRALLWGGRKEDAAAALDGTLADGLEKRSQGFLWYALAITRGDQRESQRDAVGLVHRRFLDVAAGADVCELDQLINSSLRIPEDLAAAEPPVPTGSSAIGDPFAELRRYGLPWGEEEQGYRTRLIKLCQFLIGLEHEKNRSEEEDWERITSRLQGEESRVERRARIGRLKNLATALNDLLGGYGGKPLECDQVLPCLRHLTSWKPASNGEGREKLPPLAIPLADVCAGPLSAVLTLAPVLGAGEQDEHRQRLHACLEDCLADWHWAYLQVRVRLARACLDEADAGATDASLLDLLDLAEASLREAIPQLEKAKFRQLRVQGLYGLLATIQIRRARVLRDQPESQGGRPEVTAILANARQSVLLNPISGQDRLVLVEALATLGDYEAMQVEAEIAQELAYGPETLRTLGENYWRRVATLSRKKERDHALEEAARFFEEALGYLDCAPLAAEALPNLIDTFGWAHFWLGRFQGELALYDQASTHLGIAVGMGFKPLEARVELAWVHLLARDLQQAELVFGDALLEARCLGQQGSKKIEVAPAPGEERKIQDLCFDIHLGWSLLASERDAGLALERLKDAEKLLDRVGSRRRQEQEASIAEARGRVHLFAGRIDRSLKELKDAVKKGGGSGAYCYLGMAELAATRSAEGVKKDAGLERALEACRRAEVADVRGRYDREIGELKNEVQNLRTQILAPVPKP